MQNMYILLEDMKQFKINIEENKILEGALCLYACCTDII